MLVNIASGLIVNAISEVAAVVRNRFKWGQGEQQRLVTETRSLILPAIARLQEQIAPAELDNVASFLRSPEAEILLRHYFMTLWADQIVEQEDYLKEEIAALLYLAHNLPQHAANTSAASLHRLFLELAEPAVPIVEHISLDFNFREGVWTDRAIVDLRTLPRTVEFLRQLSPQQVASIVRYENLYRAQASDRHKLIVPASWDSREPVPIDDIYVAPSLLEIDSILTDPEESKHEVSITNIFQTSQRAAILGNPGAGKSTLIEKLMYDLSRDRIRHNHSAPSIPFRVVLRDYASNKILHNTALLEYITIRVKTDYMVDIPERFVEYFLETGRGVVLFDGLDELVETHQREEIASDVRSFSSRYGSVPIIVTSRAVGYSTAPLPSGQYSHYYLKDLNDSQVEEYSHKWFTLTSAASDPDKGQLVQAFIEESTSVPDLRSNPLMLALLCNIYRGERHIPRNRADVYRRCSIMLFERWDKDRGITVALPFISHVRYAIAHLAEWIYSNQHLQSGVRESDLISKTKDYLHGRVFDTEEEAETAATQFVSFCRGRAWVFTDVGEEIYQFSHRTFLEYFTALSVSRSVSDAVEFWASLRPRLRQGEWDMVAQLALAMFDESHEGGADQVLGLLLDDVSGLAPDQVSNLISWTLRSLAAIVPTPQTRRRIVEVVLEEDIRAFPKDSSADVQIHWSILSLIAQVASENIISMADALISGLRQNVLSDDLETAVPAAVFLLILPEISDSIEDFDWRTHISDSNHALDARLRELASTNITVGPLAFRNDLVSFDELVDWHGLASLFRSYTVFTSDASASFVHALIETFAFSALNRDRDLGKGNLTTDVARVIADEIMRNFPITLDAATDITSMMGLRADADDLQFLNSVFESADTDRKLSIWLLFAVKFEAVPKELLMVNPSVTAGKFVSVLRARGEVNEDEALALGQSLVGPKYGPVVAQWISGKSVFTEFE